MENEKTCEDEKSSNENDEVWEKEKEIKVRSFMKKCQLSTIYLINIIARRVTIISCMFYQFSIATSEDVKELQEFIKKEFLTEEPCLSNLKLITDGTGGWIHKNFTSFMDKEMAEGATSKIVSLISIV